IKKQGAYCDCRSAVALVCQVAEALVAVHAQGVVHRDLKPGNILLDSKAQALLTDFGLARFQEDRDYLTVEGSVVGTPAYMAPEQVSPRFGPVSPWTDLYALGVVLYQMVTGRLPFEGPTMEVLLQIASEPLPPPTRFRNDLDPRLETILMKAMARQPED